MKALIYKLFLALVLLACTGSAACARDPRVVLHTAAGDVPVRVEIADTPERRNLGLMYRRELADDAGMLFVFDESATQSFWMKNTHLALDMIFIGEDQRIVGIVKDAVPYTTTPRTVGVPSRFVLEVNAGFSERHRVARGDRVTLEALPGIPAAP